MTGFVVVITVIGFVVVVVVTGFVVVVVVLFVCKHREVSVRWCIVASGMSWISPSWWSREPEANKLWRSGLPPDVAQTDVEGITERDGDHCLGKGEEERAKIDST